MPRLFAISDIHIDYAENLQKMVGLSDVDFQQDSLILAGDVTDDLKKLDYLFVRLVEKFRHVFYVPGNHDLWVRLKDATNSILKFEAVLELCQRYGVHTQPQQINEIANADNINSDNTKASLVQQVWVVPLFSWYIKHDEGTETLYMPKPGEDKTLSMWSDNYHAIWPTHLPNSGAVTQYFLQLNEQQITRNYPGTIISFSHFLPRGELILSTTLERAAMGGEFIDPYPAFNFSSVAGTSGLDEQIRRLGSTVHIYGHQHRNRHRVIEGVTYISNCLGYPHERSRWKIAKPPVADDLKLIWQDGMIV